MRKNKIASMIFIAALSCMTLVVLPRPAYAQGEGLLAVSPSQTLGYNPGETFYVNITIQALSDFSPGMFAYDLQLSYDTSILTATNVTSYAPFTTEFIKIIDDAAGNVISGYSWFRFPETIGLELSSSDPPRPIARIDFTVDAYGYSSLHLHNTKIVNVVAETIPTQTLDGQFVNIEIHDGAITDIELNKTIVLIGRSVGIRVTVFNNGTYPDSFNVTVYYDNTPISGTMGAWQQADLFARTSQVLTFDWNTAGLAEDVYTIKANVTVWNSTSLEWYIDTANTANNEKVDGTVNVTSTIVHDVGVVSVTSSPNQTLIGGNITVTVGLENNGNIEETFDAKLYYSNATSDYLITALNTFLWDGQSSEFTYQWNTSNVYWGEYTLKANATVPGDSNPTNNQKIDGDVKIQLNDIAIISITTDTTTQTIGQNITFEVRARNIGLQTLNFTVTLYRNSSVIGTRQATNLAPGQVTPAPPSPLALVFSWNTSGVFPGNYTIKGVAATVYGELATADNTRYLDLSPPIVTVVGEFHDLAVTNIQAPSSIVVGKTVLINMTVENKGTVDETYSATLYYNNTLINKKTSQSVNWQPGINTQLLIFTWDTTGTPLGTLVLKANVTVVAGDINATNNEITTKIESKAHDVAVTKLTVNPTAVVGSTVSITVGVQNQGSFTESFTVTFKYDSTVIRNVTIDDPALAAGATRNISISWSTLNVVPGKYNITATVSSVTDELDVADNTKTAQITITKGGSSITISLDKQEITVNEDVVISGTITPSRANVQVTIWYKVTTDQQWINLTAVKTNSQSQYSYTWTPADSGSYELYVSWAGDSVTLTSQSSPTQLSVKSAPSGGGIPLEYIAGALVVVVVVIAVLVYMLKIRKKS